MKTRGEIEAAVGDGISRFEQESMGRGPKDIRAHWIGDLLVVRLQGVLTAAEQHLVKTLPPEKDGVQPHWYPHDQAIALFTPQVTARHQGDPAHRCGGWGMASDRRKAGGRATKINADPA